MSLESLGYTNTPDSHYLIDHEEYHDNFNLNNNSHSSQNSNINNLNNNNNLNNSNNSKSTNNSNTTNTNNLSFNTENEASVVGRALTAIVDIGSNGIRFSISSKAPHHARIMPCVFKDRLGISLFDAQINSSDNDENHLLRKPIPDDAINEILRSMKRFKWICEDFGVPSNGVKVVATEATRLASNSKDFINKIFDATGWKVSLLSKEEEGTVGAFGVASSFQEVSGLFMDLGGGSTQLSWIISKNGEVKISENPISLPYGAAALNHRMKHEDINELFNEIKNSYKIAFEKIELPNYLINNGLKLFCCGGGLRGLGHLLIANEIDYPIQTIINGYSTTFNKVENMCNYLLLKRTIPKFDNNLKKIFCVSNRREQQLPAVGLLLSAAFESLPKIRTVYFSEGGVREGVLYSMFSKSIKIEDPIITSTRPYAPLLAHKYMELLKTGLPSYLDKIVPEEIENRIIPALCNIAFVHCSYPKELQPTAALHVATSGIISGSHGLSHRIRALIGIALCERWGSELPIKEKIYYSNLEKLVIDSAPRRGERMIYWTKFCGKMMHVICGIHPGGNIRPGSLKFQFINNKEESNFEVKNTLIITLPNDGIKYSASIKSRAIGFQKQIKKLNKIYSSSSSGKVKVVVQYDDNI